MYLLLSPNLRHLQAFNMEHGYHLTGSVDRYMAILIQPLFSAQLLPLVFRRPSPREIKIIHTGMRNNISNKSKVLLESTTTIAVFSLLREYRETTSLLYPLEFHILK